MTDPEPIPTPYTAALILNGGDVFFGFGIGKQGTVIGEVCFHTAMTGYQEILTDPSYSGQIIAFTFPHIGNIGSNHEDIEAAKPFAKGLILREAITQPSSYRNQSPLSDWLSSNGLTGITGIDTRALTRHIRLNGAENVAIVYSDQGSEFRVQIEEAKSRLKQQPSLEGMELAKEASCDVPYEWTQTRWEWNKGYTELRTLNSDRLHVIAIDYGCKHNILRSLAAYGCRITIVPADTSAKDILALKPDGVFLSNGPGDPAATGIYAIPVIQELLKENIPLFGICLGHQLLGLALGGKTEKMHQGHRGANHPIQQVKTKQVEITSQNHGFVVCHDNLPKDIEVTHLSLFDGTIAGFRHRNKPVFAVQYHPESSPGPHDSRYLFEEFVKMMKEAK